MGRWRSRSIRHNLTASLFLAGLLCATPAAQAQMPGGDTAAVPSAAYNAADAAHKAYARGNYAQAVRHAREAVSLAPQNAQYRQLLRTAEQAVQGGVRDQAYRAADAAYKLEAQGNYPAAVTSARRAVTLSPGNQAYRRLLADALANAGHLTEAEKVATDALSNDPHDAA